MRPIEFRVFFGEPNGKKELITAEEAFCENYIHFVGNELRPTDNCTVIQQFTGMTDGNGVKIFGAVRGEGGDLVKRYNAIFSVEYIGAEWVLKSIVKPDYCLTLALCDMSDIIIVGNAYEGVKK